MQLGGTTGGAEGLKGDSRDEAKYLDGFGRGGGRGRLGTTIRDVGALELGWANGYKGDLELGLTTDDEYDLELGLSSCDEDNLELGLTSDDEYNLELGWASDDWDDMELGLGSGMKVASGIGSGSVFMVGSVSKSAVVSGFCSAAGMAEGRLGSGWGILRKSLMWSSRKWSSFSNRSGQTAGISIFIFSSAA